MFADDAARQWIANPIDAYVLAKLREQSLSPGEAADRRTLIRRVYFDVLGLPPSPEEIDAFERDPDPQAYAKLIDRLLESPHYGERWARHWMDVSHFAETHGHDQDRPRPNAWPYRDYLIESFNADKPYGRFVREQIAGDVLYPDDPRATVALGFLAAGPWDESSQMGIQDGTIDKKIAQYLDRDDMLQNAVGAINSVTIHCARCHDHKFDPISIQDYYALQAVFAGVDRHERSFDASPETAERRHALQQRVQQLRGGRAVEELRSPQAAERVQSFVEARREAGDAWKPLVPQVYYSQQGATMTVKEDQSILLTGHNPPTDVYTVMGGVEGPKLTAVRLDVLPDDLLPQRGPGRAGNGNLHLSKIRLFASPATGGQAVPVAIRSAVADFNQEGWTIEHAIDDNPATAWGVHPEEGKAHHAVFVLADPIDAAEGVTLTVVLEQLHGGSHLIGRFGVSVSESTMTALQPLPADVAEAMAVPAERRTAEQADRLAGYVLLAEAEQELASLPAMRQVYAVTSTFAADGNFKPANGPREVYVLDRGNVTTPLNVAAPGALSCIDDLPARFELADPADEGQRRAALARWLSSEDNPLTWRSMANRVWHYHMGRGIVDTPNDFGRMGSLPTHPELLEWLAAEFRDSGGSIKHLHRLILLSATYRQAWRQFDAAEAVDADNRFYWRGNRRRLDAEQVRDAVLVVSGKLDLTMGGPSVKQFIERPGVHVTPDVDYRNFDVDDPAQVRRSIYRFLFRTLPDPLMESLDCPSGSQQTPARNVAVTPQQALAMLNNGFVARQAEHIAERLEREAKDLPAQIRRLVRLAFGRDAADAEVDRLAGYAEQHGLPAACRLVLNANEFMFVD